MKAYIIFKVRKELDHYQANTWKLKDGYFDFDKMKSHLSSLILSLSPAETRAGWTYEYEEVDIIDAPEIKQDESAELRELQPS